MNEENQPCTEQCAAIASFVDHEIARRKFDAIVDRIKKPEADTPPSSLVFHDIEGLFDKDGFVKYYSAPIWSAKELAEEFELPEEEVTRFIEHTFPMLRWENQVFRRIHSLRDAINSLGDKYFKQKREFAELKESYDALKAHSASEAKDVTPDPHSVSVLKEHIASYKTHIGCLERDLCLSKERYFEALKAVEKNEGIIQEEKKKFYIFFWVSFAIAAASHLIHLF